MFFKKIKKLMLLLLIILPTNILAYSEYIIAGGENIGIELNSKGVMVVGMYKVGNIYPAKTAGIKVGDIITDVNDIKVDNVMELVSKINELDESNIKTLDVENTTDWILTLYKENDIYKTGLYVKDNVIGIGTLTFIDPTTKIFGALGHEIIESTSGVRLEIKDGKIFESEVTNISKSSVGSPGEKNAKYDKSSNLGTVYENTINGVFGYYNEIPNKKLYKVIREGNFTNFPGLYGFFFRNCDTLPLSSNTQTMIEFMKAVDTILQRGDFILIYPEQSLWWNYRKPKPLKLGAYRFASRNNVPVIPIFITMEDTDIIDDDGFPIQEYTVNIEKPIYPDEELSEKENAKLMLKENSEVWKKVHEEFYEKPLEYTTKKEEQK